MVCRSKLSWFYLALTQLLLLGCFSGVLRSALRPEWFCIVNIDNPMAFKEMGAVGLVIVSCAAIAIFDLVRGRVRLDGDRLTVYQIVYRRGKTVNLHEITSVTLDKYWCVIYAHDTVMRLDRTMDNIDELVSVIRRHIPPLQDV